MNSLRSILLGCVYVISSSVVYADLISELPIKNINGKSYYYYEVQKGETIYGLTKKFGITEEELYQYNPAVQSGLKAYSTLYFPEDAFGKNDVSAQAQSVVSEDKNTNSENNNVATESEPDNGKKYKKQITIQRGQSLFGIAFQNDVTVDEILAMNPGLDSTNYRAGEVIWIPSDTPDNHPQQEGNNQTAANNRLNKEDFASFDRSKFETKNNKDSELRTDTLKIEVFEEELTPDTLNIALMLPFETNSSSPSKSALLYTEFYKGFLMGVKDQSKLGAPVRIKVYDSSDGAEFSRLLNDEEFRNNDLFIGPDSEQQLVELTKIANESNAYVLNVFVIKDELLQGNPSLIQTNIPREAMYAGAVNNFSLMAENSVVVFIARTEGEADKLHFTDQLKNRLESEGKDWKEVVYTGVLTQEDLASLNPSGNYCFIPVSGSRNEFGKMAGGLKEFRDEVLTAGGNIKLFGYPEWITLRGEQLQQLGELETVIYSRFDVADSFKGRRLEEEFRDWYAEEWTDVAPNQALLGYDTAIYAIKNLRKGEGDMMPSAMETFDGVQTDLHLYRNNEEDGYVNDSLFFISYRPFGGTQTEMKIIPQTSLLAQ